MFWGPSEEEQRQRTEADNAFNNPTKLPPRLGSKSPAGELPSRSYDNGSPSRQPRVKTAQDAEVFGDIAASTGVYVKGKTPTAGGGTMQDPVRVPTLDDNMSPANLRSNNPQLSSYNQGNVDSAISLADAALANANNMIRHRNDDPSQVSESVYTETVDRSEAETSYMSSTADQSATTATSDQTSTVDSSHMSQTEVSEPTTYATSVVTESVMDDVSGTKQRPIAVDTQAKKVSFPEPTPRTRNLDLRNNDNSFHVIASLIVGLFDSNLKSGAKTLVLTQDDRTQVDKMVPGHVRNAFADAVRYRLATLPPVNAQQQIHKVVCQCGLLGLDREGGKNILFAKPSSVIPINVSLAQSCLFHQRLFTKTYHNILSHLLFFCTCNDPAKVAGSSSITATCRRLFKGSANRSVGWPTRPKCC